MAQTFGSLYYEGLEAFWQLSDEEQVYIAELSGYLECHGVDSVLDIGAGNGRLALPLSDKVEDYVALEQNPEYAAKLRGAGKQVIEAAFPTEVEGTYDLVLMSHVISHTEGDHVALVPPAWDLVKPEGHFLMITHRDTEQDHWSELLERVGLGYSEAYDGNLQDCISDLSSRGESRIERVGVTLSTDSVAKMITAMAYMASNGDPARHEVFMRKASEVAEVIESDYQTADGISFPLMRQFISVQKPVTV